MKSFTLVLSFVLIAAAVNAQAQVPNTTTTLKPPPTTTTLKPTPTPAPTTTTLKPTTTTTTLKPTTTTTTLKPTTTTTTLKPTTTTLKPTTTTLKPTTTTLKPTTTTLKPTTPAPKPTEVPTPPTVQPESVQTFEVKDGKGNVCIRLDFTCQFFIPYLNVNKQNVTAELNVGKDANVSESDSFCQKKDMDQLQRITLIWGGNNSLSLTFKNETKDKKFSVVETKLSYYTDPKAFPGHPKQKTVIAVDTVNQTEFSTAIPRSYKCQAEQDVNLKEGIVMSVSNLQVEAFMEKSDASAKFSLAEVCSKDDKTSNIVPIAVGCALAALVLIVLIAYCIGRRRSRQKGYQSV